jgi:hypothetical protein
MAYLNSSTVTVDAILTTKGRELMARNDGSFRITQFALSDDEIDYTMYNSSHPSGSAFYGEAIQNMPLLQAFPDETQDLKYKLITLPRGTAKLPILDTGVGNNIILSQGATTTITPQTLNYLGNTSVFENSGYTATIADVRLASTFTGVGVGTEEVAVTNNQETLGTNVSRTVVGTSFNISATTVNNLFGTNTQLVTTLTFVGRDSGARITIPFQVNKTTT